MATTQDINTYLSANIHDGKKLVLFLDYDGTLAPISDQVDLALMTDETKKILHKIAKCPRIFTAIISGRQADNVKKLVGIPEITYAGSHGFEIIYTDGSRYTHKVSASDHNKITGAEKALKEKVARNGAWVESKGEALTLHYRETPEKDRPAVIEEGRKIIRSFGLVPTDAICAIEVQPPVNWNKGYTGEFILKTKYGENWNKIVDVMFAGDDVSDEKLMEMFKGRAATFRVSTEKDVVTAAGLRLGSQLDVIKVLRWIENRFKC